MDLHTKSPTPSELLLAVSDFPSIPRSIPLVRDRAILATLLYHGIRSEELYGLRMKDLQTREGVMHFRIHGKRKIRFIPVNPATLRMVEDYLATT